MHRMRLVLASASPRRAELLTRRRASRSTSSPADVDETPRAGEAPEAYVRCGVARDKARAAVAPTAPDAAIVLGADTVVVVDGDDPRQAARRRRRGGDAAPAVGRGRTRC